MSTEHEALILAQELDRLVIMDEVGSDNPLARNAAAKLRRLHAENQELIHDIGEYVRAASGLAAEREADLAVMREVLEVLEELQGVCTDESGGVEAITVWTPEAISKLKARVGIGRTMG